MSFRDQLKRAASLRPDARGAGRAARVSASAVGNYETGVSFPKEDVLLRCSTRCALTPTTLLRSYRTAASISPG